MKACRTATLALLATGAWGCLELDTKPPPVPEGYPQLGEYEEGKAELVIDGANYTTESGGGARYNVEGGFEGELRGSMSFDYSLHLSFRDVAPGMYGLDSGDLTASYQGAEADQECGAGTLEILGRKKYDAGLLGDREVIWGTIQLELCDDNYDAPPDIIEISGRYTSILSTI